MKPTVSEVRFLFAAPRFGDVPKWLKGVDCKSAVARPHWFESSRPHQNPRLAASWHLALSANKKPKGRTDQAVGAVATIGDANRSSPCSRDVDS